MMSKFIRFVTDYRFAHFMAVLFLVEMGVFCVLANQNKVKILILHSYTPTYSWSHGIDQGISRVLTDKQWVDDKWIDLSYHYMATKNSDDAQRRRARETAHRNIDNFRPDILIAIDDYANGLVAKDYVNNRAMSIIFAGVNGSVEPYGYTNAPNVAGIYEHKPITAMVELLNITNRYSGEQMSAIFVSDESESAKLDAEHIKSADWGENVTYKGHIAVGRFSEWKKTILNLSDEIDYILVGGYRKLETLDGSGWASPDMVAQWTDKNTEKMLIGLNIFNSEDGVPISVGVSPYEQGEAVGNMALNLIKTGQLVHGEKHLSPKQYVVSVNADTINNSSKTKNKIPNLLEAFARATNNYHQ